MVKLKMDKDETELNQKLSRASQQKPAYSILLIFSN
jgi:hypothetical protein